MAIRSVSTSGTSGTSSLSSAAFTDEETKKKLTEYGIAPTGNAIVDKAKLDAAEQAKDEKKKHLWAAKKPQETAASSPSPFIPEELLSILSQLGIEVKKDDNIDTLISKASSVIREKLSDKNLSVSERAKYQELNNQLAKFKQEVQAQSPSAMTGATALSSLNKSLLINL